MHEPIEQREALWDSFLQRWPLEQLPSMSLQAYNQAGSDDSFCRWLEKHLESLGSIWGGSSLKFGIYSRANTEKDPSGQNGVTANGRYAWYSRYGQSEEVAFARVRDLIVAAAQAAREGRLEAIEAIDLWPILKWKIAFLYQDRQQPTVLSIYLRKYLAAALTGPVPTSHAELYRVLLAERGNQPLLAYADAVYERGQVALQHQQRVAVLGHFVGATDLAPRLQAANATLAFCDLALALHEQGLDWWITEAGAIHAGRTEDFRVWQVALGLRVDVGTELTRVCVPGEEGEQWHVLEEALVDSLIESVARHSAQWPKPARAAYWPDDYDNMADRLVITLTDGAIRNGYLSVPKLQRLFPEACLGESDQPASHLFTLRLPDGRTEQTQVLKQHKRIQARFNSLFAAEGLQAGDQAVLSKVAEFDYQLSFRRTGQQDATAVPQATDLRKDMPMRDVPLNQILFGPPGTGKTYATVEAALDILDRAFLIKNRENRHLLKQRFDEYLSAGQIRLVTFHQSFSYEDFVQGVRAESNNGQLNYVIRDGIFKQVCESARGSYSYFSEDFLRALNLLKVEIGELGFLPIEDASSGLAGKLYVRGDSIVFVNSYGLDKNVLTSDLVRAYKATKLEVKGSTKALDGQLFDGVRLISEYIRSREKSVLILESVDVVEKFPSPEAAVYIRAEKYSGKCLISRPELRRWIFEHGGEPKKIQDSLSSLGLLYSSNQNVVLTRNTGIKGEQVRCWSIDLNEPLIYSAIFGFQQDENPEYSSVVEYVLRLMFERGGLNSSPDSNLIKSMTPHVLIIDEINRGNVSRIFGELITLIEPSKRSGAEEELAISLPYSETDELFSVPSNLFLIGTMNTADRSLAGLDIALRRRFVFREMPPRPELLDDVQVAELNIGQLLRVMNQRIEVLLDRDHCLGHAYFMSLKTDNSLARLELIFRNQILPLLQEYFFEDWQRIGWVLNDQHASANGTEPFIRRPQSELNLADLFGSGVAEKLSDQRWELNYQAFSSLASYQNIVG